MRNVDNRGAKSTPCWLRTIKKVVAPPPRYAPSPPRNRRGRSPSRSRSPRHYVSEISKPKSTFTQKEISTTISPKDVTIKTQQALVVLLRLWGRSGYMKWLCSLRSLHTTLLWLPSPLRIGKVAQMDSYDGTTDSDEHIENIEAILTYRSLWGAVKCKLFVTTLWRGAITSFKNLRRNSIDSWDDLCHEFTAHFIASRTKPKTVASLEGIMQGKSEPLRDYFERFNKEVVQVRGADESTKRYLIAKGLCNALFSYLIIFGWV